MMIISNIMKLKMKKFKQILLTKLIINMNGKLVVQDLLKSIIHNFVITY